MSGAYVAKPDATPESEAPPGWGNWPWPGPFPPGFDWRDYEWPGLPGGGKPSDDDDDPDSAPRIVVYPVSGLTTRESDNGVFIGTNNSLFYVVLTSPPTHAPITVPVFSRDTGEGTAGNYGITLEFEEHPLFGNEGNRWDRPRAIDLRGVMDDIEDGDVGYTIQVGPSESTYAGGVGSGQVPPPGYNDIYGSDASVTNIETVWELVVTVQLTMSTSISVPLVWPTGFARAWGWFKVTGPKGWAKHETFEDNYYHPDDAYHTITETITGQPETFEVFSKTFALSTTGRNKATFHVEYRVTADEFNGQWPFGGNWYSKAKSTMVIYMELLRDGVVQSTDTETISAEVDSQAFGSLEIISGEAHFLTDEGF